MTRARESEAKVFTIKIFAIRIQGEDEEPR